MAEWVGRGGGEGGERESECVPESQELVVGGGAMSRKEKRKAAKKEKRKQMRKEMAGKEREEEEARLNDPEEQRRIQWEEQRETERVERERREFEERERQFLEALARKKAEEEKQRMALEEELQRNQVEQENELKEDEDWDYVEEGPPEIIWQGNEIIVKKKRVRVKKKDVEQQRIEEDCDRPTSNPLPPQSEAFADYTNSSVVSAQQLLDNVAQQIPNFGTEQDKAHCPFHIKTGACRFGLRCSRVHFYPDKSCTLLIKNMYSGPGLAWEQDEGLEYTDEEVERCYEEFYEDVHTEFLKFGEIINFKVCRNGSFHLRGNVYVHYKSLDSAVLAYHSINGRFFAGKQVTCEFVGVTRWKVAICGEYMKSRLKTCSRGTACNFIHCFRNPGGDYEWADWDKPPPKYWIQKMVGLFGYSDDIGYEREMEQGSRGHPRNLTPEADRYHHRRSRSTERHTSGRKQTNTLVETSCEERTNSRNNQHGQKRNRDTDSDIDERDRNRNGVGARDSWRSSRYRNEVPESLEDRVYSEELTHDIDSSKHRSDRDRDGGRHHSRGKKSSRRRHASESPHDPRESRSRTYDSGSSDDRDWSDKETDRERDHDQKISKHWKEMSEGLDDHDQQEKRSGRSGSNGAWLDSDGDGNKHESRTTKRSRHHKKVPESRDGDRGSKSKSHDLDSNQSSLERDRDRHRSRRRRYSRYSTEMPGLSDDHGVVERHSRGEPLHNNSDLAKRELQRVSKQSHLSGRVNSSREASADEDLNSYRDHEATGSGQSEKRSKSRGLGSRYSSDEKLDKTIHRKSGNDLSAKHQKIKRKFRSDENDSPGRCSERSKSHDSAYNPGEDIDDGGRWQPDLDPKELQTRKRI